MRGIVAIFLCVLIFDVMICSAIASTFIKSEKGDKLVVVETIESTTELTPAEIDHEIDGIERDLQRIEESKQPFIDRLAKYKAMKDQCATLDIKPVVIKNDELKKLGPIND